MGQEIGLGPFSKADFVEFKSRLREETKVLKQLFDSGDLDGRAQNFGLELEGCLINAEAGPAPLNKKLIESVAHPNLVTELAKHNFEINSTKQTCRPKLLSGLYNELKDFEKKIRDHAQKIGVRSMFIGVLPTLEDSVLNADFMSEQNRYFSLAEQINRVRKGHPINVDIHGKDHLHLTRNDIMLEAATTSLQVHVQCSALQAADFYNGAMIVAAPLVAATANSPYLFAKELWYESRIPVFEQSVSYDAFRDRHSKTVHPVTFGTGFARHSLLEPFLENLDGFPVLLPILFDSEPEEFKHLSLHNGTIWRWVRPIVGVEENGSTHLRVEHRVMPAGPTVDDVMANFAVCVGLVVYYGTHPDKIRPFNFDNTKENFYDAAKYGLHARVSWPGSTGKISVQSLWQEQLLDEARAGLNFLGLDKREIAYFVDEIFSERIKSTRTGAQWMISYKNQTGRSLADLCEAYYQRQLSGEPVHRWKLS